jgi:ATP-binding cassette, subfamily B, bacterial NisT/SpaT
MKQAKREDVLMISMANVLLAFRYWPRLFRILWRVGRLNVTGVFVLNALLGVMPVVSVYATQYLINRLTTLSGAQGVDVVLGAFAFFVTAALAAVFLRTINQYVEKMFESRLSNHVHLMIMDKAGMLGLADFEDSTVQDHLKHVVNEGKNRPFQIVKLILSITTNTVTLFSAAAMLMAWKWWVALLIVLLPCLSFYSFLRLGQEEFLNHWRRSSKMRESWYLSQILTRESTIKEIKLYQIGSFLMDKFRGILDSFYIQDRQMAGKRVRLTTFYQLFSQAVIFLLLFLALKAIVAKEILIGSFVGYLQAIRMTESASQSVVQDMLSFCQSNLYLQQLFAFLDYRSSSQAAHMEVSDGALADEPIVSIEFRNVSFRYPGTVHYALQDVSFTLQQGETLAVVGRNGAGKSTLIKLLTRLYDQFQGEILINGIPIGQIDPDLLRRKIGTVLQDFTRYEMPMRLNIGFGDLAASEEDAKLWKAASDAGIDSLIRGFPHMLETQMGRLFEEGQQLSGGQWQRVAIARAYLRSADLYILDEPSSFLDPQAERDVFDRFRELVDGRIGLYITHRYSSVHIASKILVMDRGRVIELGSHRELMEAEGLYSHLYRLQTEAGSVGTEARAVEPA